MKYINANMILPEKLIEEIQKYIQGKYILYSYKKKIINLGSISGINKNIKIEIKK